MKKKILLSLLFLIMTAAGLVWQPDMKNILAADSGNGFKVESVDAGMITVFAEKLDRIYAEVKIGRKKAVTELYKFKNKKVNIDISYIKGKEATVKVYSKGHKDTPVTVEVSAQPKGLKGKFNAKTGEMTITQSGNNVDPDKLTCRIGRRTGKISDFNFENYFVKGATAYISITQTGDYKSGDDAENVTSSHKVTPASKEIKVKIPARGAGPSVSIAPNTISISVQKGWVISLTGNDGTVVSETSTQAKNVNLVEMASKAGVDIATTDENERNSVSHAAIIDVYKAATETKLQSKSTELVLPWQPIFPDENLISSISGISYTPLYNSSKTKQTGIKVNNKTSKIFLVAILGKDREISDINLTETDNSKKLVWYEVKPNRVVNITGNTIVSGAQVVYRIKGTAASGDVKLELASTIVADPDRIKIMEQARNENSLITISRNRPNGATAPTNASATALTINNYSGAVSYAYAVVPNGNIGVKLGTKREDLEKEYRNSGFCVLENDNVDKEFQLLLDTPNLWIVAFAMDNDGNVIAFASKQVTKSDMY